MYMCRTFAFSEEFHRKNIIKILFCVLLNDDIQNNIFFGEKPQIIMILYYLEACKRYFI